MQVHDRLKQVVLVLLPEGDFFPGHLRAAARHVLEDALREEILNGRTLPQALVHVTASIDVSGRFAFRDNEDHRTRVMIRNFVHVTLREIPASRSCH